MKRKCPKCNYGGKNFMMEKCPDGYTTCLKCNYRAKHNEFYVKEVKTTKTRTSMKTLEELGYRPTKERGNIAVFFNDEHFCDYIRLCEDGEVEFGMDTIITQKIHKAIGLEMRKKGWWK